MIITNDNKSVGHVEQLKRNLHLKWKNHWTETHLSPSPSIIIVVNLILFKYNDTLSKCIWDT